MIFCSLSPDPSLREDAIIPQNAQVDLFRSTEAGDLGIVKSLISQSCLISCPMLLQSSQRWSALDKEGPHTSGSVADDMSAAI
jgi:hypothetical protein